MPAPRTPTPEHSSTTWRQLRTLFLLLAPLSVPLYLIGLAYVNLAGLAAYLLVDLTITPLFRRRVAIPAAAFWPLSPILIAVGALLLVAHLATWAVRVTIGGLMAVGRWQTAVRSMPVRLLCGSVWCAVFIGGTTLCIDGMLAHRLIGREIPGSEGYSRSLRKRLVLAALPPAMQSRRQALLESLRTGVNQDLPAAEALIGRLADDRLEFADLPETIQFRIAGTPWYYVPAEASRDGAAHCAFLFGPLLLTWLIMLRWPGENHLFPTRSRRLPVFVLRVAATTAMMNYVAAFAPAELRLPSGHFDATWFKVLSLFAWFGGDPRALSPPEWLTLNLALWLMLFGGVGFIVWLAGRLWKTADLPRYYSAFLAARLLQRKRIAFFSVGAVTLCVAMLLIVASVMGGFVETIRARAGGLLGDLVLDGGLNGFPYYAEFIRDVKTLPGVREATALIHSYGTLRFESGDTFPVQIWGVTLPEYCGVNRFCESLFYNEHFPGTTTLEPVQMPVYGYNHSSGQPILPEPFESALQRWLTAQPETVRDQYTRVAQGYFPGPGEFRMDESADSRPQFIGKPYPGVIIGREIVATRLASGEYRRFQRFPRGCVCVLTMLPLTRTGVVGAEPPPAPAFRYVDDSRTGIYEIDSKNVYVDFRVLQEKLGMTAMPRASGSRTAPSRCSQIQIKLAPGTDLLDWKERIDRAWTHFSVRVRADADDVALMSRVRVSTWEEMQADFIAAIQKEKVLVVIMFGVISLVAVFLVLCIFYMIVIEKTRDIGIVKSVGGSSEGVAAVFLTYGAAIGIVGAALGNAIGYAFVCRINDIQDWLARLNPEWRIWSPQTYSFDKIPDVVNPSDMLLIGVAAILASVIGAVVPAIRAARTWPVEALRYE